MDRAKILHIEQLEDTLRRKEGDSYKNVYKFLQTQFIFFIAIENELLSVSSKRQKEIETLQEIITTLTQQLLDKDKQIEELKKSLKGNLYYISLLSQFVTRSSIHTEGEETIY